MSRLWCRDGFGEYERAIFLHPDLRADPRISQDAIHCLIESQHARSMAIRFLGDVVGQPAEGRLRRLAGDSRSPEVRRAAEAALSRIHE
jgi:hypothetical protein